MKMEEAYSEIINKLKKQKFVLNDKQELSDEILRTLRSQLKSSSPTEKMIDFLFGWVANPWLRLTMAVLTLSFILSFSYQQIIISQRINSLERQISEKEVLNSSNDPGLAISQKVLFNLFLRKHLKDSITISKNDLEELLNSYIVLKDNYNTLLENEGMNSSIREYLKQKKRIYPEQNKPGKNL